MNRLRVLFALFTLVLILATTSLAASAAGPVEAVFVAPEAEFTVGDPVEIRLEINHPAGYDVITPELGDAWAQFNIQSQSPPTVVANPDGTETTTLTFDARLFAPGAFSTPSLSLEVTDGAGHLTPVSVAPATIHIGSVLSADDSALRDIKPPFDLPIPAVWPYLAGALLAIAGALGFGMVWLRRRKGDPIDTRLPHERAFDELDRIAALRLPQQGRFKEHYTLVADCVRTFSEERYHIPMIERTSSEIRTAFKQAHLPAHEARHIIDLLEHCDVVKFSTFMPDVDDARHILALANDIVERAKPEPEQPPNALPHRPDPGSRPHRPLEANA